MPSVWYYNRSAPFWDFVASVEQQGLSHPVFGASEERAEGEEARETPSAPWAGPWGPWGGFGRGFGGPQGHHGRPHHHGPPHPHGPPPPGPPPPFGPPGHGPDGDHPPPPPEHEGEAGPSDGPGSPGEKNPEEPSHPHCRPHPGRGWGRRGRHCGRGGFGGFGGPGAFRGPFGLAGLAELFQSQTAPGENGLGRRETNDSEDFEPEADVFDTEVAFVIHVSLAGAKKEDLGVSWDAEKSELTISGVVHRPGDEDFLKTLSLDERKIGAFLRKIRLGSRANPAQIDVEGISAKLEDGILTVTVPKEDKDWTEVKKVDIE